MSFLCPNCGRDNRSDAAFCDSCGVKLELPNDELPIFGSSPGTPDRKQISAAVGGPGLFVGRQREMTALKGCLGDALSGQGRLVMVAGETGIGKTRTAQELVNYAIAMNVEVLWGRCHSAQGAPPYWPWIQTIRSYVQERDAEQLLAAMSAGASDISVVVPDVQETLPDLDPPPALEPQEARFRLFESVTGFFKRASQDRPLMLVLDNLHSADRPSLQFLEFLAQELTDSRLLVLGTYTDAELTRQHPLSLALGELTRAPSFRRVQLRGLLQEDVGGFIEAVAGFAPTHQLVNAVHTQTEGNPFFMTEVVQLLAQEGLLTSESGTGHRHLRLNIPTGVHEAIGRRLGSLSDDCNQMLNVASVIGREFELSLLEFLLEDLTGDLLLNAVEEALAARIIEESPTKVGSYQFTHFLVQDTLSKELSPTRRARLHRRIAEALEELHANGTGGHVVELAYHYAEAATATDPHKLLRYSMLAGEQALAAYAHEEALAHFERALTVKDEQSADTEMAALLFGLGRAQVVTLPRFQIHEAVAMLCRAFDYYAQNGDVKGALAVADYPLSTLPGRLTGVTQLIGDALKLVPVESSEAGRLLPRYGMALGLQEGNYEEAQNVLARAMSIAQREKNPKLEMLALANASYVDIFHLKGRESLEKSLRATVLAQHVDDPHTESLARFWAANALFDMGDLQAAQQQTSLGIAPSERLRDGQRVASSFWAQETTCRLQGQWQPAREFSNRGLAALPSDPRLLSSRAMLEGESGEVSQSHTYLERLLEYMRRTPPGPNTAYGFPAMVIPLVARITGAVTQLDAAELAAETILSSKASTPYVRMLASTGLSLMAVLQENVSAAESQYAALKAVQGAMVPASMVSADRLLGLLAETMGRSDWAVTHFDDALAFGEKTGYKPEFAWSAFDYARLLLSGVSPKMVSNTDGLDLAKTLLEQASSIARDLKMPPLLDKIETLQRVQEHHLADISDYPDGLTQREVEVLRLITQGKSNREIAQDLVLSVRTVERHITNIYGKIDARGRADATAYTLNHNLVDHT